MAQKLNEIYTDVMQEMNTPKEETPAAEVKPETEPETNAEAKPAPEVKQETSPEAKPETKPTAPKPDILDIIKAGQAQAKQVQELAAENARLKEAVNQSKQVVSQQSEVAKESVLNAVKSEQSPIDINKLMYMTPNEQQAAISNIINNAVSQKVGEIEGKIKPVLERYAATEKEMAKSKAAESMADKLPGFGDRKSNINDVMNKLDKMIPGLENVPVDQKYILSYLIDKGMRETPKNTPDDIVSEVLKNPEAMKKIREQVAREQVDANQNVPTITASGNTIPAQPTQKPQRLDEIAPKLREQYNRK